MNKILLLAASLWLLSKVIPFGETSKPLVAKNTIESPVFVDKLDTISATAALNILPNALGDIKTTNTSEFRRAFIAVYYMPIWQDMARRTGVEEAFFYSTFVWECDAETPLWTEGWNGAGIKFRERHSGFLEVHDDCGDKTCRFAAYPNLRAFLEDWAAVITQERYGKEGDAIEKLRACKKGGYFKSNSLEGRIETVLFYRRLVDNL